MSTRGNSGRDFVAKSQSSSICASHQDKSPQFFPRKKVIVAPPPYSQAEGERQSSHFKDSEIKKAVRRTLDAFTLERRPRVVHELGVALQQGH